MKVHFCEPFSISLPAGAGHSINPETEPTVNRDRYQREPFNQVQIHIKQDIGCQKYDAHMPGEYRTVTEPAAAAVDTGRSGAAPNIGDTVENRRCGHARIVSPSKGQPASAATAVRFPFPATENFLEMQRSRISDFSLARGAYDAFAEGLYIAAPLPPQIRARV